MSGFDDLITHPRESWQLPSEPVRSENSFEWTDVTQIVFHYTAATNLPDGDFGESIEDLVGFHRRMQHDYLTNRDPPYSLGYNFSVDWLGGVWEIRGDDFECAANAGVNGWSFAILCLVDGNDRATPLMARTNRVLVSRARALAGRNLKLTGHGTNSGSTTVTSCPGAGIKIDLDEGVFDPDIWTPPPPPPTPPDPGKATVTQFIAKIKDDLFYVGTGATVAVHTARSARKIVGMQLEAGTPLRDSLTRKIVDKLSDVQVNTGIWRALGGDKTIRVED